MATRQYQCFYSSLPFWADRKPDFSVLQQGGIRLYDILSEEVYCYEQDAYVVKFCRDGLCMVQLRGLDDEIDNLRVLETAPNVGKDKKRIANNRFVEVSLKYIEYLNTLQLLLDAASLETDQFALHNTFRLRSGDVFPLIWDDSRLWPIVDYSGVRGFHSGRDDLHRARWEWSYDPSLSIEEDERIAWRRVLAQPVFDRTIEQFDKVCLEYDKIQLLSQVTKALDSFNTMDWAAALVQAWFVIEVLLRIAWINHVSNRVQGLDGGTERIDRERRARLHGRNYSASIMANVLELAGEIDYKVSQQIESVRKKRNDVVHSLEIVSRLTDKPPSKSSKKNERAVGAEHCLEAFAVINHFVNKLFRLDLGLEKVQ